MFSNLWETASPVEKRLSTRKEIHASVFSGPSENCSVKLHILECWYSGESRGCICKEKSRVSPRVSEEAVQRPVVRGREVVSYRHRKRLWQVIHSRVRKKHYKLTECHSTRPLDWGSRSCRWSGLFVSLLMLGITAAIETVDRNLLGTACDGLDCRLGICRVNNRAHIEQL